ncbi:hypothetical protein VOLCADRAFT_97809 [Volvox carteri f. nagariensis]|uniref:Peptidase C1A papain C-terminal domain-containing protein n=1 Tax=Volvox carteri f. nagariensis TaxID=3068 RepID=D8UDP3_VOLCA|nr:uncharacterized protein VOLCADRAFT_97809 [Volvox carteri f. nagariensis]EFJ42077.1 hypothetical protein VOLCADRAFT_97809 [Volvox carteri f. nagariensis]|eukprot:XP_002956774.1 hypothetical protein VOLCADRAFT_97809 [Volvox carteri f. nagariensis]
MISKLILRHLTTALLAVLVSSAEGSRGRGAPSSECPLVTGYEFHRKQEAASVLILGTSAASSPDSIAEECGNTRFCNAFTAAGDLLSVPMFPVFTDMEGDGSAADVKPCDGTYLSKRTLSGLRLPADMKLEALRRVGAEKARNLRAAVAAAKRVAAKLRMKNRNPRTAYRLPAEETALDQSSVTAGSYMYDDVLDALSYPEWDSRFSGPFNFVSPVKDQGGCGACVAFAAAGMAEALIATVNNASAYDIDLSEHWLFFCSTSSGPLCEEGWYASSAVTVIANQSIPFEFNYPYRPDAPSCKLLSPPERRPGGVFKYIYITDLTAAKQHIRTYGSVTTFFAVHADLYTWSPASGASRVYVLSAALTSFVAHALTFLNPYVWDGVSPQTGYHQMAVVGYNDTGSYWIAKNSWGTGWGDKGFLLMSYNANLRPSPPSAPRPQKGVRDPPSPPPTFPPSPSYPKPPSPPPSRGDCGVCRNCNRNFLCEPHLGEKCVIGGTGCLDCGNCKTIFCGDGKCTSNSPTGGYKETCSSCPMDCGRC